MKSTVRYAAKRRINHPCHSSGTLATSTTLPLHGITPDEAEQVIENDPLELGFVFRNSEKRFPHLGETDTGRVLMVIVIERGTDLRVVTAYPADKKWREVYLEEKGRSDGKALRDA